MAITTEELESVLREQFGHEGFLPGQERVVRDLLKRRDVLAVMPTGAGKSLVFQLASQFLPGATIVVSPLIALMKDQVDAIEELGLDVGLLNSTLSAGESEDEMLKVRRHEARLLYVTPERFEDEEFVARLRRARIALLVVDEAHCVSEWGYDFRPAYLKLGKVAAQIGNPTLLALTATATPWIRRDIIEQLGMRNPDIVVRTADRPNLFLEVRRVLRPEEDARELRHILLDEPAGYPPELAAQLYEAMQGPGIIYTATTQAAEETALWLREWGIAADYYHGQRRKADRDRVQNAFMAGEIRVIAATNAFGLGVDNPNVRFVIHRHIPSSLEAYYQEAGRAGRAGQFARCTLIYRQSDLRRAAFLSATGRVSAEDLERAREALQKGKRVTTAALAEALNMGRGKLSRLVAVLERAGVVESKGAKVRLVTADFDPSAISLQSEENRKAYERTRLQMMRGYAEMRECRRRYLFNYFGQDMEEARCRMCDNDVPHGAVSLSTAADESTGEPGEGAPGEFGEDGSDPLAAFDTLEGDELSSPFAMGQRVVHRSYGAGEVQRITGDTVTVLFETAGYKTLDAQMILTSGLLIIEG